MLYREAQEILKRYARSFGTETLPLEKAIGRVVRESIMADRDYPPFNRAAMDGYAIRYDDFQQGIRQYSIAETIYAGQTAATQISAGQCYKIMTGAATPPGANVIVRREDTEEHGGIASLHLETVQPFQNIARQGEDLKRDVIIIDKPVVATPPVISLLAAVGKHQVTVERLPKVAIVTTGNEVVPVDAGVSPVQIRNSNMWLLKSLLAREGITPFMVEHVSDEPDLLQRAFAKAMEADIIIASGGVSAGDADYVPGIMERLEVQKLFHKVQIRPGKPIWCGKMPDSGMVFALPGNPLSCMVTFILFVRNWLYACYGIALPSFLPMTLRESRRKKNNLDEFFPVRIVPGTTTVEAVPFNGSGDIQAALFADGMALHQREKEWIQAGEVVQYLKI